MVLMHNKENKPHSHQITFDTFDTQIICLGCLVKSTSRVVDSGRKNEVETRVFSTAVRVSILAGVCSSFIKGKK